jgi:signal transduction histidine kinase
MPRVVTLGTIRLMRVWRPTTAVRRSEALDAALALLGAGLIAFAAWAPARVAGTPLQGPLWLRALLPFLLGVPLAARRRCPLLVWSVIWAGVCLDALVAREAPAVLGVTVVILVGSYSLGAYGSNRRGLVGLVVAAAGVAIATTSADGWSGQLVVGGYQVVEYASGIPVLVAGFIAFWVAGVVVRIRRDAAALAVRNEALDRAAERAGVAERARIAREMHDILAHHLSVVVLQAAGARAAGSPSLETLEKIEHSGRQALAETRLLLGVLRGPDDGVELAPQPGIAALPALVASVRRAGLPVSLAVDGERAQLPGAVDVSAYRIVQEALTNVLKHARPARAQVQIDCSRDVVTIEVRDDGSGVTGTASEASSGHGLLGIRERVAVLGGELRAGPEPGGGFAVRATLPLGCRPAGDGGWT